MGSWERFDETSLPEKEAFYINLSIKSIRDVDYRHAKIIFKEFSIKNLSKYHDLYVQSDTLLLADVFENFTNKFIEIHELDPAHFLSAPGLAWQTCLKKTGVKLELLTDINMSLTVEKGISYHDKNKKSSYLMHLDANNLYGWAMSPKFHVNGFKWKKSIHKSIEKFILNYDADSDKGHILEVDIEYPKNLLNLHDYLPFLAERKKIKKCDKLVCNINDKDNYVVYKRALKQALNHGLILKKVLKVIKFNQEACLKPYIDMNTKLRTEAKKDSEKN